MFVFGHDRRVTINADSLDLRDARRAIRSEHQPKQLGHEVVKFLAIVWIGMVGALGTGLDAFLDATRANGAPSGFRVLVTPLALSTQMRPTGTTVKAAVGNHFGLGSNIGHVTISSVK